VIKVRQIAALCHSSSGGIITRIFSNASRVLAKAVCTCHTPLSNTLRYLPREYHDVKCFGRFYFTTHNNHYVIILCVISRCTILWVRRRKKKLKQYTPTKLPKKTFQASKWPFLSYLIIPFVQWGPYYIVLHFDSNFRTRYATRCP